MAYIDLKLVKVKDLKTYLNILNRIGLLNKRLNISGKKEILAGSFKNAIEAINANNALDSIPDAIFDYYLQIVKPGSPPKSSGNGLEPPMERLVKLEAQLRDALERIHVLEAIVFPPDDFEVPPT